MAACACATAKLSIQEGATKHHECEIHHEQPSAEEQHAQGVHLHGCGGPCAAISSLQPLSPEVEVLGSDEATHHHPKEHQCEELRPALPMRA